jgi:hypothetical protein
VPNKPPKVAIGIVSYGHQPPSFWKTLAENCASLYKDGIEFDQIFWAGGSQVDVNRNTVAYDFRTQSDADWLWWIDADNPPPFGTLHRLLSLGMPAVSGLYYGGELHKEIIPIAYLKTKQGTYRTLDRVVPNWEVGEMYQVDAVGMGCFLTHRSVYDDIENHFMLLQRAYGGWLVVPKEDVSGETPTLPIKNSTVGKVVDGLYTEPVCIPKQDNVRFPFFMAQWARTEDFIFCEMLRKTGEIWLDTSVEAGHVKDYVITGTHYRDMYENAVSIEDVDYV